MTVRTRIGTLTVVALAGTSFALVPSATAAPFLPSITSIKPDTGEISGGVHIEVTGKHLDTVDSATIGGHAATISRPGGMDRHHELLLLVPAMSAGTYQVVVTAPSGSSATSARTKYTYTPARPWVLDDSPPGIGSGDSTFTATGCSPATCYAVGTTRSGPHADDGRPLIDFRTGTASWAATTITAPRAGFDNVTAVNSVSCSGQDVCVATGADLPDTDDFVQPRPIALVGSEDQWSASRPPLPSDRTSDAPVRGLTGACVRDRCVVVGFYGIDGGSKRLLVDTYADGTWTQRTPAPVHAASADDFDNPAVACPSGTHCFAVARDGRRTPVALRIPLTGSGKATVQKLPWHASNSRDNVSMNAIACWSGSDCVATGYEFLPASDPDYDPGLPYAFFETLHKGHWTMHHFALPSAIKAHNPRQVRWDQASVDCATSADRCYATGAVYALWTDKQGTHHKYGATSTRIDRSGQRSVFAAVPDPFIDESKFTNTFCAHRATTCTAIGFEGTPTGTPGNFDDVKTFSVHLGTPDRPRLYNYPQFDGHSGVLTSVACAAVANCVAAGYHVESDGRDVGWVQHN